MSKKTSINQKAALMETDASMSTQKEMGWEQRRIVPTGWRASAVSLTRPSHDPAKKGIKTKQAFFAQGVQQHLPVQWLESQSMSMQDQVNFHVNMMITVLSGIDL